MDKFNPVTPVIPGNFSNSYGWHSGADAYSCSYISPNILSLLKKYNIKRVLDIGSGNGALCSFLHQHGFDVVGIEYDKEGFNLSRTLYPDIRFYNCGVQDSPTLILSSEAPFDAVISTEVIEHLFSPHQLPLFAKPFIKNNGFLFISTPYHGYLKNLAISLINKWDDHLNPLWHGGHIKFWSKYTLTKLLNTLGYRVVLFKGVGRFSFFWKSMIIVSKINY